MADFLEDAKLEWAALVAGAWPEVIAPADEAGLVRGIYLAEHAEDLPLDQIEPPYAVISIPDWPRELWAFDALTFEPIVSFYYILEAQGPTTEVRAQLALLRELLLPEAPSPGILEMSQVMDILMESTSRDIPLNQALRERGAQMQAGMVSARIIVERPLV
jgi:hypothetical protein